MKHYELEEFQEQDIKPGKVERLRSLLRGESVQAPEDIPIEPQPEPVRKTRTIAELAVEQAKKKIVAEKEKERMLSMDPNKTVIEPPRPVYVQPAQPAYKIPDHELYEQPTNTIPTPPTPMPDPVIIKRKGLARLTGIFHRKPKVQKQKVPAEIKEHARYRMVDSGILMFAFLVGTVSVILVYHELPTHPYLIIGIAGIAVSVGIITGINRW